VPAPEERKRRHPREQPDPEKQRASLPPPQCRNLQDQRHFMVDDSKNVRVLVLLTQHKRPKAQHRQCDQTKVNNRCQTGRIDERLRTSAHSVDRCNDYVQAGKKGNEEKSETNVCDHI